MNAEVPYPELQKDSIHYQKASAANLLATLISQCLADIRDMIEDRDTGSGGMTAQRQQPLAGRAVIAGAEFRPVDQSGETASTEDMLAIFDEMASKGMVRHVYFEGEQVASAFTGSRRGFQLVTGGYSRPLASQP